MTNAFEIEFGSYINVHTEKQVPVQYCGKSAARVFSNFAHDTVKPQIAHRTTSH